MRSRFWRGKRVFVTGHTGFKGGWLTAWLVRLGAVVRGYSLKPDGNPSLFEALKLGGRCEHVIGDVLDSRRLASEIRAFRPQVVFHLAAQPLVRRSYSEPILTFETNALGTANLLESCRGLKGLKAVVCVTTDKCYRPRAGGRPYREDDPLGGADPYSASKACAELVVASYRDSYGLPAASARAGNVIGGGDWSADRLIPDAVRAFAKGRPVAIRSPEAIRPWQHVLEPLAGYLLLAQAGAVGAWNFGPRRGQRVKVRRVIEEFRSRWPGARWHAGRPDASKPEAAWLALDSGLSRRKLGWDPKLSLKDAISWTADWYRRFYLHEDMWAATQRQIEEFEDL